ncbi:MAG: TIGR00730 family Rossman fold protein [Anaerolineae bacterium]|nr:TIGR00730 family Rossman fold protein [Anaerolineae bacterium]
MITSVCVFCGSSDGTAPIVQAAATELGEALARRGLTLVYGGGNTGLMGRVANGALAAGGTVVGIIPQALITRENQHLQLTETHIVDSMHERKAMMSDRAEGYIALPGGFGTFEELFEIITWAQLGIHNKPIIVYNLAGYYDPLLQMVASAAAQGFIRPTESTLFNVADRLADVFDHLENFAPRIQTRQWLKPNQI